jgi:general secretion pathway protein L
MVTGAAQRLGLRPFWQWWLSQLEPTMPTLIRNAMRLMRLRPVLAIDTDGATLWVPSLTRGTLSYKGSTRILMSSDAAAVAQAGRTAIDALPRAGIGRASTDTRVLVSLPATQVLRKTLTLPAAVEESLRQALVYDLDRHAPFKPDELYFDAAVVGRSSQRNEIFVDWAAALKPVVDQACLRAESWGAAVVGVTPESPESLLANSGAMLNLLPVPMRPRVSWLRRIGIRIALALTCAVTFAAVALPIWQKREAAIALTQSAERARLQADAARGLQQQLERSVSDYNFVLQKKHLFPAAVQVVEDISKLLPDNTWLTQFEIKTTASGKDQRRAVVLRGESANAGHLVTLLEESNLFEQAAPRSPTTKIQPGPGEIFELGAQLKPLPPPQLLPVVDEPGGVGLPMTAPNRASSVPLPPINPPVGAAKAADTAGPTPAPVTVRPDRLPAAGPPPAMVTPDKTLATSPTPAKPPPTASANAPDAPLAHDVPDDY